MKPSEFYVGVLDFFAILLPGAIATAILLPHYGSLVVGPLIPDFQSASARVLSFFVCAYFAGHLIFLLGSYIDPLYNRLRERLNPYGNESGFQCATRIRDSLISADERRALNTFQWSRSVLLALNRPAAEDVHRLEADSKFFRSLLVLCLVAAIAFGVRRQWPQGAVAMLLVVPSFARYYERRLKSTTMAYIHVITLHRLGKLVPGKGAELAA